MEERHKGKKTNKKRLLLRKRIRKWAENSVILARQRKNEVKMHKKQVKKVYKLTK